MINGLLKLLLLIVFITDSTWAFVAVNSSITKEWVFGTLKKFGEKLKP